MPTRPLGPCSQPGCPGRATHAGRCERHQRPRPPDNRPTAAQRGYDYAWQRRREAFLRQHPSCVVCGEPATDVDHIVPKRQGGTDDESNLQALCHRHHSMKTAKGK